MPWTGEDFRKKHDASLSKAQASKAASIANAMLGRGAPEGEAIATAIKRSKASAGESLYPGKANGS